MCYFCIVGYLYNFQSLDSHLKLTEYFSYPSELSHMAMIEKAEIDELTGGAARLLRDHFLTE